jgi:hypothetical protein
MIYKGRGTLQITGRRPYKASMPPHKAVILGNYEVMDTDQVDGETWYTVQVIPRVSVWLRTQPKHLCYEHKTVYNYKVLNTFDIHEKVYTMLMLMWS